jgi:hypothetical protein
VSPTGLVDLEYGAIFDVFVEVVVVVVVLRSWNYGYKTHHGGLRSCWSRGLREQLERALPGIPLPDVIWI